MICGGSGFIGQNLAQHLLKQGHSIVILDRNASRISSPYLQSFQIDLLQPGLFDQKWFEGVEAVINLSGKDIFTFWNQKNKKMIRDSRVQVNQNLIQFISKLPQRPDVFISASAVGYYGNRGETELLENEDPGEGFLAEVCKEWESEARKAERLGMRSVQVRTAPVLLKNGGIMLQMLKSMQFGLTFVFGSGNQWFSWIHMNDLLQIYHKAAVNKALSGPVNASSPHPVRFREFLYQLANSKKALLLPFPGWLLRLFLQETADVVLFSQKMIPGKLLKANFQFSYPKLEDALREIFSENKNNIDL
jgi:uncharacterized protein (TIGR01777 family)